MSLSAKCKEGLAHIRDEGIPFTIYSLRWREGKLLDRTAPLITWPKYSTDIQDHMCNNNKLMLSIFFHSLSKKGHYPSSSSTPLLHPSHYHSPAIIHSHPTATGRWQYGDRGGDNPAMSSMVLPTVCEDLPEFSPIGGGERESSPNVYERDRRRVCSKSLFPVTPCKNVSSFSFIKDL